MRDRDVIGFGVLAVLLMGYKRIPWGGGWWWPVPEVIMSGASYLPQVTNGPTAAHAGSDIMFRTKAGTYFAPVGTPITAARAGKVWSVSKTARGWGVVLDHGRPFATFYQHLASVTALVKGMPVAAGQPLGTMGYDPLDASRVRHLHFSVWFDGFGDAASVDPTGVIGSWLRPGAWKAP